MDQIIQKLYPWDAHSFIVALLDHYQEKWHSIVNFLYFANAMQYHLFESKLQTGDDKTYAQSLLQGDFLLPDGIALQLWSKRIAKKNLHNLNGTDLTPLVLSHLNQQWDSSIYISSLYDPHIGKWEEWLDRALHAINRTYPHIQIAFAHQSLYSRRGEDFPWETLKERISRDDNAVKVFLHCTWTPFQERWIEEHREFFREQWMLVMNVGGFIDFIAGFEKRAPAWVVKARVLETFRRIATNPRKNLKKFLAMFGILRILLQKLRLKNS